jgi:AraC-like DNA-binding protein
MAHARVSPVREIVASPETGPVFRLEYADVRFWYPLHFHPEVEIKHVVRGSGTRLVGESVEPFEADDLCVVGSGTPHSWSSAPERGRWVRARFVQFRPTVLGPQASPAAFQPLVGLLERARRGLQLVGPTRKEALAELTRIFDARTDTRQVAHLVALLAIAAEGPDVRTLCTAASESPAHGARRDLSERVLRFVQEHYRRPITEASVAREFGQSPSAFSRFFAREFGRSFSRYVAELRVANASNLLLTESLKVREIAEQVGFRTVASLNRHFRAVKMTTPLAYRRRGRELNAGLRAREGEILRCDGSGQRPAL